MILVDKAGNPRVPPSIAEAVVADNLVFLHHLHMFGPELCEFVIQACAVFLAQITALPPDEIAGDANRLLLLTLLEYGCKVVARAADTTAFGRYCTALLPLLCSHPQLAKIALGFDEAQPDLFKDVLLRNPTPAIRSAFASLLAKVVEFLAPVEAGRYLETELREMDEPYVSGTQVEGGSTVEVISYRKASRQVYSCATTQFVSRMVNVSSLDYAALNWKNFNEYFGLLLTVAHLGRPQRQLLNELHTDLLLLDLYLGVQSPLYGVGNIFDPSKRPREVMANKQARADFTQLLATASLLIRSGAPISSTKGPLSPRIILTGTDADAELIKRQHDAYAACADPNTFDWTSGLPPEVVPWQFNQHLRGILSCEAMITLPLSRGDNPVAVAEMVAHSCWRSPGLSVKAIDTFLGCLDAATADNLSYCFVFLERFISINDYVKPKRLTQLFHGHDSCKNRGALALMEEYGVKYPWYQYQCMHYLIRIALLDADVGAYLITVDGLLFEWEQFLRRYAKDPKNCAAKAVDPALNPALSVADTKLFAEKLDGHPSVLGIPDERYYLYRLKLTEAKCAERTLLAFECVLRQHGFEPVGEAGIAAIVQEQAKLAASGGGAAVPALAAAESSTSSIDSDEDQLYGLD